MFLVMASLDFDVKANFTSIGIDSLAGIEFANLIGMEFPEVYLNKIEQTNFPKPPLLIYELPTVDAVATALLACTGLT